MAKKAASTEKKLERIHPRLPSDLMNELRDYCRANGNIDREYVLALALREFLKKKAPILR